MTGGGGWSRKVCNSQCVGGGGKGGRERENFRKRKMANEGAH